MLGTWCLRLVKLAQARKPVEIGKTALEELVATSCAQAWRSDGEATAENIDGQSRHRTDAPRLAVVTERHGVIAGAGAPDDRRLAEQPDRLAKDALAAAVDIDQGDAAALPALEAEGIGVGELQRQLR